MQAPGTCAGVRFAELDVNRTIKAGPYKVSETEILQFASTYDPQWFHTDTKAAASGPFQGLIASGWHTSAIAMRLAVDALFKDAETLASPGVGYIKWPHPVRPGDCLTLHASVLESRRAASRPLLGIVRWRWQLRNQHQIEVLELESTVLYDLAANRPKLQDA